MPEVAREHKMCICSVVGVAGATAARSPKSVITVLSDTSVTLVIVRWSFFASRASLGSKALSKCQFCRNKTPPCCPSVAANSRMIDDVISNATLSEESPRGLQKMLRMLCDAKGCSLSRSPVRMLDRCRCRMRCGCEWCSCLVRCTLPWPRLFDFAELASDTKRSSAFTTCLARSRRTTWTTRIVSASVNLLMILKLYLTYPPHSTCETAAQRQGGIPARVRQL